MPSQVGPTSPEEAIKILKEVHNADRGKRTALKVATVVLAVIVALAAVALLCHFFPAIGLFPIFTLLTHLPVYTVVITFVIATALMGISWALLRHYEKKLDERRQEAIKYLSEDMKKKDETIRDLQTQSSVFYQDNIQLQSDLHTQGNGLKDLVAAVKHREGSEEAEEVKNGAQYVFDRYALLRIRNEKLNTTIAELEKTIAEQEAAIKSLRQQVPTKTTSQVLSQVEPTENGIELSQYIPPQPDPVKSPTEGQKHFRFFTNQINWEETPSKIIDQIMGASYTQEGSELFQSKAHSTNNDGLLKSTIAVREALEGPTPPAHALALSEILLEQALNACTVQTTSAIEENIPHENDITYHTQALLEEIRKGIKFRQTPVKEPASEPNLLEEIRQGIELRKTPVKEQAPLNQKEVALAKLALDWTEKLNAQDFDRGALETSHIWDSLIQSTVFEVQAREHDAPAHNAPQVTPPETNFKIPIHSKDELDQMANRRDADTLAAFEKIKSRQAALGESTEEASHPPAEFGFKETKVTEG